MLTMTKTQKEIIRVNISSAASRVDKCRYLCMSIRIYPFMSGIASSARSNFNGSSIPDIMFLLTLKNSSNPFNVFYDLLKP